MTPHPTPTPRQRAILKKEAKRTYGFPAVGINNILSHLPLKVPLNRQWNTPTYSKAQSCWDPGKPRLMRSFTLAH